MSSSPIIQTPESIKRVLHERHPILAGRVDVYQDTSMRVYARWGSGRVSGICLGSCVYESAISVADRIEHAVRTGEGVMRESVV